MEQDITMTYTGVIKIKGKKTVRVRFERPDRPEQAFAEYQIPSCQMDSSFGFSEEELQQLGKYLRDHLDCIYEKATKIHPDLFTILGDK